MVNLRVLVRASAVAMTCAVIAACSSLLGIEDGIPRDDADAGCNANLLVDTANCGVCGHACANGQVCSNGACKSGCDAPFATCAGAQGCIDLTQDPAHCGSCTTACGKADAGAPDASSEGGADAGPLDFGTPACVKSACTITCSGTKQSCGGLCFDTSRDHDHCGGCGTACAANEACSAGHCCAAGMSYCNGACVDTTSDSKNCGTCGMTCSGATPFCSSSQCYAGLSIAIEGHANELVNCKPGDFNCEGREVCNKVTGLQCVFQQYDCYFGNQGSWYPPDGQSGSSAFNFAFTYDLAAGTYGNICACTPSQMTKYGLASNHPTCGLGHWVRQ